MNSVILWISTTSFLKYYKLLEVLHAAQPNLSKLNHMILDCVFAWKQCGESEADEAGTRENLPTQHDENI